MATLTVTITEAITSGPPTASTTNSFDVSGINQFMERQVSCPDSATTTIAIFADAINSTAGSIDVDDTRYLRVTNLETSGNLTLGIVGDADTYQVNLMPGQSHIICNTALFFNAEGSDVAPEMANLQDIENLQINNATGSASKVELFVAGV